MNVSDKILSINFQEDMTTYLWFSLPLCIVLSDKSNLQWYYESFIQMYTILEHSSGNIKIDHCGVELDDVLKYQKIKYGKACTLVSDIIDFVKDNINSSRYLSICLDEYYMPCKRGYNNRHFIHHSLIYGYSDTQNLLYIIGMDRNNKLSLLTLDYKDCINAYESSKMNWSHGEKYSYIEIISMIGTEYRYSSIRFLERFKELVFSIEDRLIVDSFQDPLRAFGFSAYDILLISLQSEEAPPLDYRSFHLLAQHKNALQKRFIYIKNNYNVNNNLNALISEYQKTIKLFDLIRCMYLKQALIETQFESIYQPIKSSAIKEKIYTKLSIAKTYEYDISKEIYYELEKLFLY